MLFNSWQYIIFFISTTILYFIITDKFRWIFLLLASCFCYMAFIPSYILILGAIILIDYFAAILMESTYGGRRKYYLWLSIIFNCSVLFIFKYFNFFNDNIMTFAKFFKINYNVQNLNIALPLGLSFHVFQSISYSIEVYKDKFKAEKNLGRYALFIMFYPTIAAGPIEKPQNLIKQFHDKHNFNYDNLVRGLTLMGWGFFKKIVIADRLAIFVSQIYNYPSKFTGVFLLLGATFYVFQLYCDFSGYSDIAIGTARVLGFELTQNFNRPFAAQSIAQLWRRWHISLSNWLADYIYMPIAIKTRDWGKLGVVVAIMCTFVFIGLWHGANWTFLLWGGLHGIGTTIDLITPNFKKAKFKKISNALVSLLGIISTFSFLIVTYIFLGQKAYLKQVTFY